MGRLLDQFNKKKNYNYGCNDYIPNYNSNQITTNYRFNNTTTINNKTNNNEYAFMGYDGPGKMYGVHKWNGNGN
jgi:hypothetical protein